MPNISVQIRATGKYNDKEEKADDDTVYRKNAKTETTSKTTWNKDEPCRNGHDVTTLWCKQEPNEQAATTWYKQEQMTTNMCKKSRRMMNPYWTFQLYVTKTPYSFC